MALEPKWQHVGGQGVAGLQSSGVYGLHPVGDQQLREGFKGKWIRSRCEPGEDHDATAPVCMEIGTIGLRGGTGP